MVPELITAFSVSRKAAAVACVACEPLRSGGNWIPIGTVRGSGPAVL